MLIGLKYRKVTLMIVRTFFKDEIKLIKDLRGIQADWQEVDYSKWSRLLLFDAKAYFESLRPA